MDGLKENIFNRETFWHTYGFVFKHKRIILTCKNIEGNWSKTENQEYFYHSFLKVFLLYLITMIN